MSEIYPVEAAIEASREQCPFCVPAGVLWQCSLVPNAYYGEIPCAAGHESGCPVLRALRGLK